MISYRPRYSAADICEWYNRVSRSNQLHKEFGEAVAVQRLSAIISHALVFSFNHFQVLFPIYAELLM